MMDADNDMKTLTNSGLKQTKEHPTDKQAWEGVRRRHACQRDTPQKSGGG
jgi:hypothetical protein